ncbi:MAG: FAD-dependent monooxygenase, partial [Novosphingobium meiothermophilum]
MLRINELKLPLDHTPEELPAAICARLGIAPHALERFHVFRRGNDARKKHAILLTYVVDCVIRDETEVLARFAHDPNVRPTPDTTYRFPVMAPQGWQGERPVVIGAGPCGLMAGLILAQMGLKPIIIERGKA